MAREAARELGIHRPISVIPNGLDVQWFETADNREVHDAFGLPRGRLLIVFAGRMERRKGIHLCTEIASSILERFEVTFVLAGHDLFGYVQGTLLPTLASRRLKGTIHWLGALGNADLQPLVRAADIVLLPSLWENCPYACLEAMATGRAVIGADQGGMPELIQSGVNGLLATPNDAPSFTRSIERLIENPELRTRLGSAARETVRTRYSHTRVVRQTLDVYEGLVSASSRAAL
jgi:glycosyltransferase involved in cell wall biosynthesis